MTIHTPNIARNYIETRHATKHDAAALCSILNEIIVIGGTTAYQKNLNEANFREHFLTGDNCINCFVAHQSDSILGFQALSLRSDLPVGWVDIATFARANPKVKGVGTALFNCTKLYLNGEKYTHINASIRADNRSGLVYYTKMGFTDYNVRKGVPLQDGTPVDRISKQFEI